MKLPAEIINPVESQCEGKTAYATGQLAWEVLERRRRKQRALQVYRCDHCGKFHHGTAKGAPSSWSAK